jgi:hypothetical protein
MRLVELVPTRPFTKRTDLGKGVQIPFNCRSVPVYISEKCT